MIKTRIRVIQIDDEYVNYFQYSQGECSYTTVPNIMLALDLDPDVEPSAQFIEECLVKRGGVVDEYDITIELVTRGPAAVEAPKPSAKERKQT